MYREYYVLVYQITMLCSISQVMQANLPWLTLNSLRRNMCHANIVKFRDAMSAVDWREILSMSDTQVAYSSFHKLISDEYNKCFPIRKINKKYFNNKPWLTIALKESIKTKNKLYIDRYKGVNCNERCKMYKAYRNKLNHLLRSAERKHYQDLLNEQRSNGKKAWQIIKFIINKRKYNPYAQNLSAMILL